MSSSKPDFDAAIAANEDLSDLQSLDLRQRGVLIISACQAAVAIEAGKRRSGLPPSKPDEWPQSTWQFLKKCTAHARSTR